jgi:hypothetical protein
MLNSIGISAGLQRKNFRGETTQFPKYQQKRRKQYEASFQ